MQEKSKITIYCDGGARNNPGPAASAFVVTEGRKVLAKGSKFFKKETNNVAEYNSVLLAMEWILKNKNEEGLSVVFNLDSQLIQRQLTGVYKIKNENLKKYFLQIKEIEKKLKPEIIFKWQYRHKNKLADELVNKTMDENLQREN